MSGPSKDDLFRRMRVVDDSIKGEHPAVQDWLLESIAQRLANLNRIECATRLYRLADRYAVDPGDPLTADLVTK